MSKQASRIVRITTVSALGSLAFTSALFAIYLVLTSQLALAQAADSLLDVVTALVLALAVRLSAKPGDEGHPAGHSAAEPLAGLLVAVLAALLAMQVAERSVDALLHGATVQGDWLLTFAFAGKGVFRLAIWWWIGAAGAGSLGPAAVALRVDTRNDVLLAGTSVLGTLAIDAGFQGADAWLALPLAVWIAWSGLDLGRANVSLLMGAAPSAEVTVRLLALAAVVDGVLGVHRARIHYLGTQLEVHLHIEVDPNLTIAAAHAIGERVRERVEREAEVGHCSVHLDVAGEP